MSFSPLELLAREEIARPLFSALAEAALKGTLLLLGAWALARLTRRGSASIRHLIWTAGLASVLVLPVMTAVIPRLEIAWPRRTPMEQQVVASTVVRAEAPRAVGMPTDLAPSTLSARPVVPTLLDRMPTWSDIVHAAPMIWAIVAMLVFARVALGMARLSLWTRRARPVIDGEWLALTRRLASQLGIERPVSLLQSDRACIPMTWGIVYPVVLLPHDADEWSQDRRAIVLLHELAHVQRFDALTQFIAQFAVALFWFNPLVWIAARHMRAERERACDDVVLAFGARASDYASDLLQIARGLVGAAGAPAVAALAMARRGEFEGRLLAILDPHTRRQTVSRARTFGASIGVIALALPLAALTPATSSTPQVVVAPVPVASAPILDSARKTSPSAPTSKVVARPVEDTSVRVLPPLGPLPPMPDDLAPMKTSVAATTPTVYAPTLPTLSSLAKTVTNASPDRETLIAVLRQAVKMTSDYDRAELLLVVAKHYTPDDEVRTAYLDAVSAMHSSYDQARVLLPLFLKDDFPAPAIAQVVKVASRLSSDNDKASIFVRVLNDRAPIASGVRDAIIAGAGTIRSSSERARTLVAVVKAGELSNQQLIDLLGATKGMTSSNDKANVLLGVAARHQLTDKAVRTAFLESAESILSASDYRRVMTGLLR